MTDSADSIAEQMKRLIEQAIPGAHVAVRPGSPRHYEVAVDSEAFEGKSRIKQQQMVYGAIAELMAGDSAPVHAIDRLETRVPSK